LRQNENQSKFVEMKALVWEAPRAMAMRDNAMPQPHSHEVVIKVAYAGICGSELSGYLGHSSLRVPPLVMGHEFAGEIVALGSQTQTSQPFDKLRAGSSNPSTSSGQALPTLQLGQPVTANPIISCGECVYCQQGKAQLCLRRKVIGAHLAGAYAEYVVVPAASVLSLPANLSTRMGALAEPTACAVRIAEMAGEVRDQVVLVVGAGPIGLLAMQVLLLRGARQVLISDIGSKRLEMARVLGGLPLNPKDLDVVQVAREATDGLGVVASVDAVGTAITRKTCVQATRNAGMVVLTGLHEETSAMPVAEMIRREIVGKGCFAYSPDNFAEALVLLADGKIQLDPWIVEAPLEEGGQWFERLLDAPGNVAKVLLVP
jgi:threonine dehydrogenase-like Zn-dependent dehydrogenase